MRLIRHLNDLSATELSAGTAITIGAFDGLHLGHQHLLSRTKKAGEESGLATLVMSFEPTPAEYFASARPPARLMRFREKFEALAGHGIDYFFCPRFSTQMRDISTQDFIRRILLHGLRMRHIVVGDDFRFARKRAGGVEDLMRHSQLLGYAVEQQSSVAVNGIRVSSTAIREALWQGDMLRAAALLGRPYRMSGVVVQGRKLGRELGYPTANVDLRRRQSAVMGIFAVRVVGLGHKPLEAVASVGTRPTFDGVKPLLEVHIFDFDQDIYGRYLHIDFIARLRAEQKYDQVDELVAQMHRDADNAKAALAGAPI